MDESVLLLPQAFSLNVEELHGGNRKVEEVVADLYARLRPSLLSYSYYLVGSSCEAEDLIQIAFLRLFDQLNQRTDIKNVRAWLYRVVHNLAVEHAKQSDRRTSLLRGWFTERDTSSALASVEENLIKREQIESCLALLSERERHALMLRAEGLSYSEIAEILQTSVKSVSVYLARGLKKFESKQ
jgi:RNA polymerase sigma-70 factor (ECF subfamily)